MSEPRFVFDTNVLVSAALFFDSTPGRALELGRAIGRVLVAEPTIEELGRVLMRPKFDRYLSADERAKFFGRLVDDSELIRIGELIHDCRDAKDNKFLELAVDGRATHLVTGDEDLLVLHPFRGVSIVTPQAFLDEFSTPASIESEL